MTIEEQSTPSAEARQNSFFQDFAQELLKTRKTGNFLTCAVIFPNTRPKNYFKEALIQNFEGESLILPALFSMDEWMAKLSPYAPIGETEARLALYKSFKAIKNPEEHLDQFWTLSQALFQDHELLVRNLAPIEKLFYHIRYWEETGAAFADFLTEEQKNTLQNFWSFFESDNLSIARKRFIQLWRALPAVYEHFQQTLRSQGRATSAMIYADSLNGLNQNPWVNAFDDLHFVGFGALSKAELAMISELNNMGKAQLTWDLENWYFQNSRHEVARLFAPYRQSEVFAASLEAAISKNKKEKPQSRFQIIACQGAAGMSLQIAEIAKQSGAETAIILTDPSLVSALLLHEPENAQSYNITLGFPLEETPACQWLLKLLRWKVKSKNRQAIDLDQWLQDPFTKQHFPTIQNLRTSKTEVKTSDHELFDKLPSWIKEEQVAPFLSALQHWWAEQVSPYAETLFESSLAGSIAEILEKLSLWIGRYELTDMGFSAFLTLFQSTLKSERLTIKGSKDQGIQVLGLYESRLLDFEHVVVAPAEQGKLCGSGDQQSFLTESIRRSFGLPLMATQLEDQVYQFYRLTHRARTVTLLVDDRPDFKEDRIVQQIRFSKDFEVEEKAQVRTGAQPIVQPTVLLKDERCFQILNSFFGPCPEGSKKRNLSPNSIHQLLVCPLKFYYKYVLNLEERKEASHLEMSRQDYGNWVHTLVQDLYAEFAPKDRPLNHLDYEKMMEELPGRKESTWAKLNEKISPGPLSQYRIEEKMGQKMAEGFFRFMAQAAPHSWRGNEWNLTPLGFKIAELEWQISGRCDLVFETEQEFWLVDLKTGGSDKKTVGNWASPKTEKTLLGDKDLFQMAVYDMVAKQNRDFKDKNTRVFLFKMGDPTPELFEPLKNSNKADIHENMSAWISQNIQEMMDPAVAITQTEDFTRCRLCDFKEICRR